MVKGFRQQRLMPDVVGKRPSFGPSRIRIGNLLPENTRLMRSNAVPRAGQGLRSLIKRRFA